MIVRCAKNHWRTSSATITRPFQRRQSPASAAAQRYTALVGALEHHGFVMPLFALAVFGVYVLMGGVVFLFAERFPTESALNKFRFNQLLNRQQFAREIETMIFNNTDNILVIVDKTHSKRIHENLMRYLKTYETRLFELHNRKYTPFGPTSLSRSASGAPYAEELWTLRSSINYALALLITLGHATRQPLTISGQFFAMSYSMFGIPFLAITLILVAKYIVRTIMEHMPQIKRNCALVTLSCAYAYAGWIFAFAAIISANVIFDDLWQSGFTAIFASLSIQSQYYNAFDEAQKLLTLICVFVSLILSTVIALLLCATFDFCPCVCTHLYNSKARRSSHTLSDVGIKANLSTTATTAHYDAAEPYSPPSSTVQHFQEIDESTASILQQPMDKLQTVKVVRTSALPCLKDVKA